MDFQFSVRLPLGLCDFKITHSIDLEVNIIGFFLSDADGNSVKLDVPLIGHSCSRFESICKLLLSRVLCFLLSLIYTGSTDSKVRV